MQKIKHWFTGLSAKIIAGCIMVALSVCIAVAWIGYSTYKTNIIELYERLAETVVLEAEEIVNVDALEHCIKTRVKDEAYMDMQHRLDRLKDDSKVEWLYAMRVTADQSGMEYLITAFNAEERKDAEYATSPLLESDYENYSELIPQFLELQKKRGVVTIIQNYTQDFGATMSSHLPLYASDGELVGILAVDIAINEVNMVLNRYLLSISLGTMALLVLFIGVYIYINRRMILQPIKRLAESAESFVDRKEGEGGVLVNNFPVIKSGDEIEVMADAFRDMASSIQGYMDNLQRVTRDRERIATELHVATTIQASMLPTGFLTEKPNLRFDIYATMEPAKEVGGDFYDYFMIDEDHLGITMADVSGKGVPAALFMAIGKTIIQHCAQLGITPGQVLHRANEQLCQSNEGGLFITTFFGVLELSTGKLRFANAGHNPPLLRQGGADFDWLNSRRALPLAAMEGINYRDAEVQLEVGDLLFLYTDGVTEAVNKAQELYGDPRLLNTVRSLENEGMLKELLLGVKADIERFEDGAEQADDITMLIVRYQGAIKQAAQE